jgi:hypothetical protein
MERNTFTISFYVLRTRVAKDGQVSGETISCALAEFGDADFFFFSNYF